MKIKRELLYWPLGLLAWLSLLGFSQWRYNGTAMTELKFQYRDAATGYFSRADELRAEIFAQWPDLQEKPLGEINTALLEESLDAHPAIAKSEVFSTVGRRLLIELTENQPLARVMGSTSYYLLPGGAEMPLSPHYAAQVPLIDGVPDSATAQLMAEFLQQIKEEAFFADFIDALHLDAYGHWTLSPRRGDFKIELGAPEKLEQKMRRLRIFYQYGLAAEAMDSIAALNLAFENQVICRNK